jgi:hypothetical protein
MARELDTLLAPPWGLPGEGDARLLGYLRDDDWAAAETLLRARLDEPSPRPVWLVLLAYARFRDASEVMVDELPQACRECLAWLDRAAESGAPMDSVAPLRDAVERALDDVSREELRLTSRLGPEDDATALPVEDLEAAAFALAHAAPARAARLFAQLAQRTEGPRSVVARARSALCLVEAGRRDEAQPLLADAFAQDWTQPGLASERLVLESVATALLEAASGDDFVALWRLAEARGQALRFPFPSAWPNQERLLRRCLAVGDGPKARALAERIEDERPEVSPALAGLLCQARGGRA